MKGLAEGSDFSDKEVEELLSEFVMALEKGDIRAAEKVGGKWQANAWVKKGILSIFGHAENVEREEGRSYYDVMPTRNVEEFPGKGARNTPGTTLRVGNFFGEGATVMSEAYVNIGVYVDNGSMVDSNVTTGSCAQIGKDVHIGANTLIGGVLEPIEDTPVIIEDGASIGGGSMITSGFKVGENVEVAENTLLTPRIDVYDLVENEVIRGKIPANRRVFQRYVTSSLGQHELFQENNLNPQKPVAVAINKEEDAVELEEELRMD
ncbi:MAG: 2,3,4,5-tetrahydropyridine-2,6-dicarboxylate N-succinyltransferase [Candidatus Nanohalobium sp.]